MIWTGIHKTFSSTLTATKLDLTQIKKVNCTFSLMLSILIITKLVKAKNCVAFFAKDTREL